ncbi:MAG: hypothetical protein JRI65_14110 [Deltaproteobacteria bacterium]|nr:hypothetical protein [Deltaproteobacteria bacterium]
MKELQILDEPVLDFRYGQSTIDPRDGLSIFGPYDTDMPSHPRNIVYGAIGTKGGLSKFTEFAQILTSPVLTAVQEYDYRNWPHFPGFEAAFACSLPDTPAFAHEVDENRLNKEIADYDAHKRASRLVEMYLEGFAVAAKKDENLGIIFCVVPDIVWKHCRPESQVEQGSGVKVSAKERKLRRAGKDFFNSYEPEDYLRSVDFRRQLKARSMEYGIPIQIIKESTLKLRVGDDLGLAKDSPSSAVAWFLSTAIYYKAGGKPWRLGTARDGVCYVGLVFRRSEHMSGLAKTACCAAQMFLDTGDGVVFKGEFGPWYSPETKEYHLSAKMAEVLLRGILATYKELHGKPIKEVFLHSRSPINQEEYEGYSRACPDDVKLVGIQVRRVDDELRLFRPGKKPVLRGTFLSASKKKCYLWTSGFKPRLETYDGFGVPVPLSIIVQHGECDLEQVAFDILGLTKLNYNSCRLGQSCPVTVGFSDKVGEILVTNPTAKSCRPQFKFYI